MNFEPSSRSRNYIANYEQVTFDDYSAALPIGKDHIFPFAYTEGGVRYLMEFIAGPNQLVWTNYATKEVKSSATAYNLNQFRRYGGHHHERHIFWIAGATIFQNYGMGPSNNFLFLDTKSSKCWDMPVSIFTSDYYEACFTKEGHIITNPVGRSIHILNRAGDRILRKVERPRSYKGTALYNVNGSCFIRPDGVHFRADRADRSVDMVVFDPQRNLVAGIVKGDPNCITIHSFVRHDMTSCIYHADCMLPGLPFPPPDPIEVVTVRRLDTGHHAFGLVVGLCDGYYTLPRKRIRPTTSAPSEEQIERRKNTHRFFAIAARLPMDLQALLCNKLGDNPHKDHISPTEFNALRANYL